MIADEIVENANPVLSAPKVSKPLERLQLELEELENRFDDGSFFPRSATGKQISPNFMKAEIRKHLAETGKTQTYFANEISVNGHSFSKFMTMRYKDQWSAVQNGTYEAAGRFLARFKIQKKIDEILAKKKDPKNESGRKRSADESVDAGSTEATAAASSAPSKKKSKDEIDAELRAITSVDVPVQCPVFFNCDEIRQMINRYLISSGIPQARWLDAIGAVSKSLSDFRKMKGKGAGASNYIYQKAFRFFEQRRILEKKPKSKKQLEQESRWGPSGFRLKHDNGKRLVLNGEVTDPRIFDIEYCQDYRKAHGYCS
jgi:hypothetical protein